MQPSLKTLDDNEDLEDDSDKYGEIYIPGDTKKGNKIMCINNFLIFS